MTVIVTVPVEIALAVAVNVLLGNGFAGERETMPVLLEYALNGGTPAIIPKLIAVPWNTDMLLGLSPIDIAPRGVIVTVVVAKEPTLSTTVNVTACCVNTTGG